MFGKWLTITITIRGSVNGLLKRFYVRTSTVMGEICGIYRKDNRSPSSGSRIRTVCLWKY